MTWSSWSIWRWRDLPALRESVKGNVRGAVAHSVGGRNPIGRRVRPFGDEGPAFEIVGVVKDTRFRSVRDPVSPTSLRSMPAHAASVLAIGASTGGIHALGTLFQNLPRQIGVPILITQHLPIPFMSVFARQLGAVAVELLLRRIGDPHAEPKAVELPTHLVVRRSCGCQLEDDDHHAPKG